MTLANRFQWTERQVDETDPDLVEELLTFVGAEGDHQRMVKRERERKAT